MPAQVDVNLMGTARMTQAFLPLLRRAALDNASGVGGRVLFMSSVAGSVAVPGMTGYA